jgi:hypothetical protein
MEGMMKQYQNRVKKKERKQTRKRKKETKDGSELENTSIQLSDFMHNPRSL